MRMRRTHEKEKTRRIDPHVVNQLFKRYIHASSFGHLRNFLSFYQPDNLRDDNVERLRRFAQRPKGGMEPFYVAVMICAPNINERVIPPRVLIKMISHIREKKTRLPLLNNYHPH